jgi:hypothetical protein
MKAPPGRLTYRDIEGLGVASRRTLNRLVRAKIIRPERRGHRTVWFKALDVERWLGTPLVCVAGQWRFAELAREVA